MRPVVSLALALAVATSGCQADADPGLPPDAPTTRPASPSTPAGEPVPVRVVFFQAPDGAEGASRAVSAFQAAALAFSNAAFVGDLPVTIDLVAGDVAADAATVTAAVAEVTADPSVVAAIGAPGLGQQAVLGDALRAAGVPWVSLSGLGQRLADRDWPGWMRMVAPQEAEARVLADAADALAEEADRAGACLLGDGTTVSRSLLRAVTRSIEADVVLRTPIPESRMGITGTARDVEAAGCGVVVWGGGGSLAAAVRRQLVEDGLGRVAFIGGDRMRDQEYLDAVGPAGEGTQATCPCVDLSTSTDLAAQRFIQDYQAEYGLPPGPYAVEAWDAARLLLTAFREGASSRAEVLAAIDGTGSYDGLAGTYGFEPSGELLVPESHVTVAEVAGGRWLVLTPSA
jgi:branched-chain amino acid transport system substrate-binding protein